MFITNKIKSVILPLYRYFTSKLKRNTEISDVLFSLGNGSQTFGREKFDSFIGEKLKETKFKASSGPSVSAIYRVKNGAEYIESAILSVAPLVKEIIVVDNGSTDQTINIIERLKVELEGVTEVKLYHYQKKMELAGDGYLDRLKDNPEGSLAKFYEYCFNLGTSDYLMKCDAHVIFTLKGLRDIQEALSANPDIVYFSGTEIFGKVLDYEPSLFKKSCGYKFIDKEKWEKLEFPEKVKSIYVFSPVFLHLKRLSYAKYILNNDASNLAKVKYSDK